MSFVPDPAPPANLGPLPNPFNGSGLPSGVSPLPVVPISPGSSNSSSTPSGFSLSIPQLPQAIGQALLGSSYDLLLAEEHGLIFVLFVGAALILLYAIVTDQQPQDIVINTTKTIGKAAANAAAESVLA